jgi:hypothetical protein
VKLQTTLIFQNRSTTSFRYFERADLITFEKTRPIIYSLNTTVMDDIYSFVKNKMKLLACVIWVNTLKFIRLNSFVTYKNNVNFILIPMKESSTEKKKNSFKTCSFSLIIQRLSSLISISANASSGFSPQLFFFLHTAPIWFYSPTQFSHSISSAPCLQ